MVGAYGLIGQGVSLKLLANGHKVTGLGRNLATAKRVIPGIPWVQHDVSQLRDPSDWNAVLSEFTVVVNCSGALQDSPQDDLEAIHHHAIAALAEACSSENIRLIQISAVGADPDASTPFMASKGRGDAAIKRAGGTWHIFRPGLVLATNAYGGTAMLRMLAAFPLFQPIAVPEAKIQTVALEDVAQAVAAAADGQIATGCELDLVESQVHTLRDIIGSIRHWLGFAPAKFEFVVPDFVVHAIARLADGLAFLGWRSPLRSTAIRVLRHSVVGDSNALDRYGLPHARPLAETLSKTPVGAQDRLSARMSLLLPLTIFCLSLFWMISGLTGLLQVDEASRILVSAGWTVEWAVAGVVFWSLIDMAIGVAFAFRKYAPGACWAAIFVSVFYLLASTYSVPALWMDPLGPLVKIVPAIALALVARVMLEAR